jgi:hypothetical protein
MTRKKDPRSARLPVGDIVAQGGELPPFTPVPRQGNRHDGWTPERQRAFIEALADTGSVAAACKAVDMSTVGAYHLRRQPGAEPFRAAWQAALHLGVSRIEDVAMDRALNGVEEPLYSYGKLVGTRTRYNDRLLMFILRNRAPERFAAGGGPRGLNAISQMQLDRLKKDWLAQHEAGKRNVTAREVRESIDRKIEAIRRQMEPLRIAQWSRMSDETRAAWDRFVDLRDRDLAAMEADAPSRKLVEVEWDADAGVFTPSEDLKHLHDRLAQQGTERPSGYDEIPKPPPGWRQKPPPREPKTVWTLKDESFDP